MRSTTMQFLGVSIFAFFCLSANAATFEAKCGNGRIVASGSRIERFDGNSSSGRQVYSPPNDHHTVVGLAACGKGVVTAFRDDRSNTDWAYYSPDCAFVGGGGKTVHAYKGSNHRITSLEPHPAGGVSTTFENVRNGKKTTYHSPDCLNIGGGGNTTR